MRFPNASNRGLVPNRYYGGWQPRVALAYQLNEKTVFRAGFAKFESYYQFGAATPDSTPSMDGFTATTPWYSTYQNAGAIPGTTLSNPFPSGIILPTGSSLGAMTDVGLSVTGGVNAPGWDTQPISWPGTWAFSVTFPETFSWTSIRSARKGPTCFTVVTLPCNTWGRRLSTNPWRN